MRPAIVARPTVLTTLPDEPVRFALHHERHVYVSQPGHVTVIDPGLNTRTFFVDFDPVTWAAFGSSVCLYDPKHGILQLSGSHRVVEESGEGHYAAPFAQPALDGTTFDRSFSYSTHMGEQNGAIYNEVGPLRRFESFGAVIEADKITGVASTAGHNLLLTNDRDQFAFYNGAWGKLLYGTPPARTVPQVLPNNLLIAGTPDGYVFSPDHGASWRTRFLGGFGVPTGHGMLRIVGRDVELMKGGL